MKKIIFIFFCSILIFILFQNFFLKKILVYQLQKITEKNIKVENVNINLKNGNLIINKIRIKNDQKFNYKNLFICDQIIINFKYSNLFKKTILFDKILFNKPIIFIEVKENNLEDNISVLEKKKKSYKPKEYPQKKIDRNIILKKVQIQEFKANILIENIYKYEDLKLSNMNFLNVGTDERSNLHFKKVFKLILSDLYLRIPDYEIQKKLKDIYRIR